MVNPYGAHVRDYAVLDAHAVRRLHHDAVCSTLSVDGEAAEDTAPGALTVTPSPVGTLIPA